MSQNSPYQPFFISKEQESDPSKLMFPQIQKNSFNTSKKSSKKSFNKEKYKTCVKNVLKQYPDGLEIGVMVKKVKTELK